MKRLYELHGQGLSIRRLAEVLGVSRNSVRKYLRSPGVPKARPRPARASKLDPFAPYLQERLAEGVTNCVVLLRELRQRGYGGGYTILKDYVQPHRRPRQPRATARFETAPGEQAQVDFGQVTYETAAGETKKVYAFVLVLSWSRASYLEFVPRADVAAFLRCQLNAFAALGGVPRTGLYDNAKLVVLGRDGTGEPVWQPEFLDFCRRLGLVPRLCRPYRAQTKGRVERGVGYVKANFWPGVRTFADLADLNEQARVWCATVANVRVHGTTGERPCDRLAAERAALRPLPALAAVAPLLREARTVGRDGFVRWQQASYGVPWRFAGQTVQVEASEGLVELWAGDERLAVHPRATRPHQRFPVPGQWDGLTAGEGRPRRAPRVVQAPPTVERRSLLVYEAAAREEAGRC